MKKHSKVFISFMVLLIFSIGLSLTYLVEKDYLGIRKNTSESLPFKYFISFKKKAIQRGVYVSIDHPKSPFLLLAKQIAGVPGDEISIVDKMIRINGKALGLMKSSFTNGESLTPIEESIIPEGYVFVYATHPDSFDSRYAEFGLVDIEYLKEVLWPLF